MRLDEFLVKHNFISSRSRAKRAIMQGLVRVNSKIITKPSYNVTDIDKIEILEPHAEYPEGYWKLREIHTRIDKQLIKKGDIVIDLGSSAGGFILYALQFDPKLIIGIEYSKSFKGHLSKIQKLYNNVKIIYGDAFKLSLDKFPPCDVLLCDLTVEPFATITVLQRFMSLIKSEGRILFSLKGIKKLSEQDLYNLLEPISDLIQRDSIIAVNSNEKNELFVYCEKK